MSQQISKKELMQRAGVKHPYFLEKALNLGVISTEKVQKHYKGVIMSSIYMEDMITPLRDFCYQEVSSGETVIMSFTSTPQKFK
jgi:hypothetical protein